jgi:hypothetical protein
MTLALWIQNIIKILSKRLILLVLIMASSLLLSAQSELTGAIGLTFGMNKNAVKGFIVQKGGTIENAKGGTLLITNVTMDTKRPVMVMCKFVNYRLFEISAYFIPSLEDKTQELYDEINGIVESKYGKGQSFRDFKGIYEDGDGFEMQAVKTGNASIATYWRNFINSNVICLEIYSLSDNLYVRLTYQDGNLAAKVEKQKAKKD